MVKTRENPLKIILVTISLFISSCGVSNAGFAMGKNYFSYCNKYHTQNSKTWHVKPNSTKEVDSRLEFALAHAKPGDTLLLNAGVYSQPIKVRTSGIVLRSLVPRKAKIIVPFNDKKIPFAISVSAKTECVSIEGIDISGGYYYALNLESEWNSISKKQGQSAKYISILNNNLHHSGRDVIKLKPKVEYVRIYRNVISHSGQRYSKNAEGIDVVNASNVFIEQNRLFEIATTGIYVKGGTKNSHIQRNWISNTGGGGIFVGFDTSPAYFDLSNNPKMFEAIDTVVTHNLIEDTALAGLGVYAAKNSNLAFNTLKRNALEAQSSVVLGLSYQDNHHSANRPPSENVNLISNVIYASSLSIDVRAQNNRKLGYLSSLRGFLEMRGNVFINFGGKTKFIDRRAQSEFETHSLKAWQSHNSTSTTNVELMQDKSQSDGFSQIKSLSQPSGNFYSTIDICGNTNAETVHPGAFSATSANVPSCLSLIF